MMSEYSVYQQMDDSEMKLHKGDVVCYPGDERLTCRHFTVTGVVRETHPFYTQIWYLLTDRSGREMSGLAENVEQLVKIS